MLAYLVVDGVRRSIHGPRPALWQQRVAQGDGRALPLRVEVAQEDGPLWSQLVFGLEQREIFLSALDKHRVEFTSRLEPRAKRLVPSL